MSDELADTCWDEMDGGCEGPITLRFGVACPSHGESLQRSVCAAHASNWDGPTWCDQCPDVLLVFSEPIGVSVAAS